MSNLSSRCARIHRAEEREDEPEPTGRRRAASEVKEVIKSCTKDTWGKHPIMVHFMGPNAWAPRNGPQCSLVAGPVDGFFPTEGTLPLTPLTSTELAQEPGEKPFFWRKRAQFQLEQPGLPAVFSGSCRLVVCVDGCFLGSPGFGDERTLLGKNCLTS